MGTKMSVLEDQKKKGEGLARKEERRKGKQMMDVWQFIFEPAHLATIVGAILCLAWAIRYGLLPPILAHRERLQELRNEELRLELQILQANKAQVKQDPPDAFDRLASTEEVQSEEGASAAYQTGYQQQQSSEKKR